MTSSIPSLLSPYIRVPPESSQTLITGVLGATTNWLVLRYLYACLGPGTHAQNVPGEGQIDDRRDTVVILVSWMRDLEFWRTEARRTVVRCANSATQAAYAMIED